MFRTKVIEKITATFSRKSCRLRDYMEEYGTAGQATDDNTLCRMRFACWITKAKERHSQYITFIAIPWQKVLRERASLLRYIYIVCSRF